MLKQLPFKRYMQIAGGVLKWSELQFWDATLPYFLASVAGWSEANGAGKSQKPDEVAMADYEDTKQEYAAYLNMSDADLAQLKAEKEKE